MSQAPRLIDALAAEARAAPPSGIVEVHLKALGRPEVAKLWVGEGNLPTPPEVSAAASAALLAGETFYTHQAGLPELRAALARYHDRVYGGLWGQPLDPRRFLVTGSGMHAITMAIACVAGAGDEVLVPTPAWPNFGAAVGVHGATMRELPMRFGACGWDIDPAEIAAAVGPRTRALFLNTPSNPTGWVATAERLASILATARKHGLWIIADEIYGRFCYRGDGPVAPSLHALIAPEDRVIFVNTFSKNWAMTGWRIGWIEVPAELDPVIQNLIQYSSSGTAAFMQRGAIAALETGDAFVAYQVSRAAENRATLLEALAASERIRLSPPDGAFYLFFSVDGEPDTRSLCLRLVDEARVGLAPGSAFGAAGSQFVRLCFAGDGNLLREATERLTEWLQR